MNSIITLKDCAEILKNRDNILILCHRSPDGDTIGSAFALLYALQKMGKKCMVDCTDTFAKKYSYILKSAKPQQFTPEFIVAVDVAAQDMLGEKFKNTVPDLVIDHHISNTHYGKQSCVIDNGANCENIYELIKLLEVEIDSDIANALYTGVATDTGCFKFSNTTANSHIIAADLIKHGADFNDINRIMFDTKSHSRLQVEQYVYSNVTLFAENKAAIIDIPFSVCEKAKATPEELDGITGLPRQIEGVLIGITIREQKDGSIRASVRTHSPFDASNLCQKFGGGGHIRAAGCSFKGSISEAREQLISATEEMLEEYNE